MHENPAKNIMGRFSMSIQQTIFRQKNRFHVGKRGHRLKVICPGNYRQNADRQKIM